MEVVLKLLACGVKNESEILVLSPYRAQCHIIEQELAANKLSEVSVTSIVKSQGTFERKEIDIVVKLKKTYASLRTGFQVEGDVKEQRAKRWNQPLLNGGGGGRMAREPVDFVLIGCVHFAISLSDC